MSDDLEYNETPENEALLEEGLSQACLPPEPVPSEIDEAVLAMARQRLSRKTRILTLERVAVVAAAAVVVIAIGVSLLMPAEKTAPKPVLSAAALSMNINGDEGVDILDAFALAQKIKTGVAADESYDFNRDRLLDGRDVEMIAMAAVSLNTGAVR